MTVPAEAVQTGADGNSKFVMVIAPDSAAHKKPVTLGIQNARMMCRS
jgi:multidrug efflux pump subunit AcrA (membrane-fusion protein)